MCLAGSRLPALMDWVCLPRQTRPGWSLLLANQHVGGWRPSMRWVRMKHHFIDRDQTH